jgi:hypothetical protein
MTASTRFAPRALLRRQTVRVALTPFELSLLIEAMQARASRAAENADSIDLADHWFCRIAQLREALR